MEAGNLFLAEFMVRFNERFAVRAVRTENLHRPVTVTADRLQDILCHREQRHVGQQLTLAYDRKQLILDRSVVSEELGGQYVDLYDFSEGRLEVRWKGQVLPYRIFDGNRGTMKLSHPSHSPWKSQVQRFPHYAPHRLLRTFLLCRDLANSTLHQQSSYNTLYYQTRFTRV